MYCTKCNAKIPADARFCPNCGTPLGADENTTVETASVQQTQPQAGAATTEKMKVALWKKILLGFAAFIALAVFLSLFLTNETNDLQTLADNHLAALRNGDIETAYNKASPQFKQATSLERFRQFVAAHPVLTRHTEFNFESRGFENDNGYVNGYLAINGKKMARIEFRMRKTGGNWTIERYILNPP